MTSSQWVDLVVLGIAFVAGISGWRSGALGSMLSFLGVVLGAVAGVLLAPHIVTHIDGPRTKLFVTLFLILALVVVGEIAGVVLGRAVRSAIRNRGLRAVDSLVGVAIQMVAVLVAAWMLTYPLQSSDQPNLAAAVRGSKVLKEVDGVAPEWLRSVPNRLSALLDTSGLPDVLQPFGRTPIVAVDAPDAALASDPVVEATRPSVVKIRGVAPGCQKVLEGTGFVAAPNRVMSNAHVVAGSESVTVDIDGQTYDAYVVSYDPQADISILDVPDLPAAPLQFAETPATTGTDAVVMGFPGGGNFVATPARVREIIELSGPDIYRTGTVEREVYTIRGTVRQGNSGGPMIDREGRVLGVVFGAAVDDADTGFVLTANEVSQQLAKLGATQRVATGACVP
ncbi:trypsin-like serine protease with C-terminal PDZ domain [Mycolicibacterium phlei]|jgi:S1-C subfamily serine protease|uniref:Serine protease n=1 Tax=Mycolicibacterium phlei DSM 43239 = CCUG 21000 TaxID=1226750 RepID=A0A5N5VEH9_MYCPH|nr:acid resistance serine protease MarP [Mycolicibacterium phlei]VEG07370.1 trypsin-like serine protease with C-terminal PDZ domain [Mycobacteroides chelonae]AMO59238.1 Serine protease [Mycolicibacterium phlei]EID13798.1 trypsin-like serine protease with C-terminal PDZ domain [Mycolicibacterium phlei RIVM601174]KAB7759030.1 serine protease [Mycolicibacterium phlei DSM 43239 = CCUG 21000]KXW67515.1 serine protease [Mycolicibacterium phlei DSM 43239 = CCUG 21000]